MLPMPGTDPRYLVEFHAIDTPGQSIFYPRDLGTELWGNADAVLLVFDLTSRDSFASLSKWHRRVQEALGGVSSVMGAIVGTRADVEESRRVVAEEDIQEFAESVNMPYFPVAVVRPRCRLGRAGLPRPRARLCGPGCCA